MPEPPLPGGAATPANDHPLHAPALRRRMAAWMYEGVLLFGVIVPAALVFSVATQMRHALAFRQGLIAFLFLVLAAYFAWFWSKGQTLAMKTWHIRVVDRHGRPVTLARAVLRYVFAYVWFLPPLAAFGTRQVAVWPLLAMLAGWVAIWALLSLLHPQRQFWHDVLAGTRLVHSPPPPRR